MGSYSAKTKNKMYAVSGESECGWRSSLLSKVSKTRKGKYHVFSLMCGLKAEAGLLGGEGAEWEGQKRRNEAGWEIRKQSVICLKENVTMKPTAVTTNDIIKTSYLKKRKTFYWD